MDYKKYCSVRQEAESIVEYMEKLPPKKENQIDYRPHPKITKMNNLIRNIESEKNEQQREIYLQELEQTVHSLKYNYILKYRIRTEVKNLINEIIY
jgi:hypothetical protein